MIPIALLTLLAAVAPAQNIVKLSDTAEIEFISESCVRVTRGKLAQRTPITGVTVAKRTDDTNFETKFTTADLSVLYDQRTGLIAINVLAGLNLFKETAATLASLDLDIRASERFYGLGPRPQPTLDARGLKLTPLWPFYISSKGYAFWLPPRSKAAFDIGQSSPTQMRISAAAGETFEYYFAFGPSLKEIWEERARVTGNVDNPSRHDLGLISMPRLPSVATPLPPSDLKGRDLLCADANALIHASVSGQLLPAFDLSRYRSADDDTFRQAARLGAFTPLLYDSAPDPQPSTARAAMLDEARTTRRRLSHILMAYIDEARYRGYPMLHPLMMQFPRDPEAALHLNPYTFGDEFLMAPVCDGSKQHEVYLPMGTWTNWHTNQTYQGRRKVTIDVPEDGLILLTKNGALIPLNGIKDDDPTELHYFPKNGGEFFILEQEASDYTQAHAGPAGDIYRVEIESKVARRYEWVIHHFDHPKKVAEPEGPQYEETKPPGTLKPRTWRYDAARRELRIGVDSPAKSDLIVNISF